MPNGDFLFAFATFSSQAKVTENRYQIIPFQLVATALAVGTYLYNTLLLWNPADAYINETADDDSVEEYDYVKKDFQRRRDWFQHGSVLSDI